MTINQLKSATIIIFFKSQLNNLGIPFPISGDQDEDLEDFENNEIFDLDFQEKSNVEIIGLSSKDLFEIEKKCPR